MGDEKITKYLNLLNKYGRLDIESAPLDKPNLLDIATGHGKYAIAAALAGYKVTAFDSRPDRIPSYYKGIQWKIADLKEFCYRGYEVVNCLGIFYHLTLEGQLKLLSDLRDTPLIIMDTHLSTYALRVMPGGYEGSDFEEVLTDPRSSFDDPVAFWHNRKSFLKILKDSGYKIIEEVEQIPNRSFYVLRRL